MAGLPQPLTSTELRAHLRVVRESITRDYAVAPESIEETVKKMEGELGAREAVVAALQQVYEGNAHFADISVRQRLPPRPLLPRPHPCSATAC